jgi:hypothetical protein
MESLEMSTTYNSQNAQGLLRSSMHAMRQQQQQQQKQQPEPMKAKHESFGSMTSFSTSLSSLSNIKSSSSCSAKSAKSVSISDSSPVIHVVKSLEDYSEEELEETWFTRTEFDEIKTSYKDLIFRMRNKEFLKDTDDCCTRGLEGRSKAGARHRREIILNSLVAVLTEQQRQREERRSDPEAIASVYRQHSYHSLQAAANMGRRDQYSIAEEIDTSPDRLSLMRKQYSLGSYPSINSAGSSCPMMTRPGGGRNLGLQGGRRSSGSSPRRSSKVLVRPDGQRRAAAA